MWIEKSNEKWVKIVQVERMNANETCDELENAEFEFETLVGRFDELEQFLGKILRIVDEIERTEIDHCVSVSFAFLFLASHSF